MPENTAAAQINRFKSIGFYNFALLKAESMAKKSYIYVLIVGVLCAGMAAVLHLGQSLEIGKYVEKVAPPSVPLPSTSVWTAFEAQLHHPLSILLIQIVAIILAARSLAWLMTKIGQPTVIGEIIAGILLGPSLLGWLSPEMSHFLFPS